MAAHNGASRDSRSPPARSMARTRPSRTESFDWIVANGVKAIGASAAPISAPASV